MRARVLPALVAAALGGACAPRAAVTGPRAQELTAGAARFRIVYWPEDAHAAQDVRRALEVAAARVERWGGLRQPVTVYLHPTHGGLEAEAQRPGYDWLHAWARYDTVDLQSPRTWEWRPVRLRRIEEVLTHELTHCAMYQLAGDAQSWTGKQIPRWFAEGLASVTAGQGRDHAGLEALSAFYRAELPAADAAARAPTRAAFVALALPGDPLADLEPVSRAQYELVYGAAHHAVTFLLARYGERRVGEVLRLMGAGRRFPTAFRQAIGLGEDEFTAEFRRYVAWEGWRR